jgi:hypothetical protein
MRHATFLLGILLGAASLRAAPILVTLEDSGPSVFGPLSFAFDMKQQPPAPYDFADAFEFSGDFIRKEGYYRIHVADYFRVDMGGVPGYGYNWWLEVAPRAFGIYEKYCEIRFFTAPGETLVLLGAWTTSWSVDTPIFASRYAGDEILSNSQMHISSIVPEPASLALFALGLGAVAGMALVRRKRQGAPAP